MQIATPVGFALAMLRLWRARIQSRYIYLIWFFGLRVGVFGPLAVLDRRSTLYFYIWAITLIPLWLTSILVVRELFGLILERHKGLYTLGRWAMYAGSALSIILSIFTLLPKIPLAQRSRLLTYAYPVDRGLSLALAVFLLLMLLWLSRYPVRLGRNVIVHASLFTVYFLGNSLGTLLYSLFGVKLRGTMLDVSLLAVSAACAWLWFLLLSAKGEEVQVSLPRFSPEDEERILYKLDALNATLLKAGR